MTADETIPLTETNFTPHDVRKWKANPGPQTEVLMRTEDEIMMGGARGGSKLSPLDTIIYTPFGARKIGDLKLGDTICNPNGSPQSVIGVFPQGEKDIYRVSFSDGASLEVGLEHLWLAKETLKHQSKVKSDYLGISGFGGKIYTTAQLIKILEKKESAPQGSFMSMRNVLIPLCAPLKFTRSYATNPVTVEPYILGVLIGDGCLTKKRALKTYYSSYDEEIAEFIEELGYEVKSSDNKEWAISNKDDLHDRLVKLGIHGKVANQKFIPTCYQYATVGQRIELVKGMMDTDGSVDSRGHMSYTTVSEVLAKDFQFTIRSLGGKATITDYIPDYTYKGKKLQGQRAYTVYFNTKINSQLVNLSRKINRSVDEFNGGCSELSRRMVNIEFVGKKEAVCIKVSNPNGLYVADDFIVTHNTETGMVWMVLPKYISNPLYAGLVIRRNADDLTSWIERARHMYGCLGAVFSGKPPIIRFPSGAYIKLGHLKDENAYTKYMGHEYQKINVEELTQIPSEDSYLKLISSSRSTVPELKAQVFSSCNPGGVGHLWVKKRFVDIARNKTYFTEAKVAGKMVRKSRIFIPARVDDCPQIMENDPGYIVFLESLSDMLREAWRYGNWDVFFGQFFDEWNPKIHIVEPFQIHEQWNRYRGFDWGYAKPSACVWIAVDPTGNHYLYREFYENNNAPNIVAQKIQTINYDKDGNPEKIVATYADPSIWAKSQYGKGKWKEQATAKSINDTFVENGFYCQKANNDRLSGWAKLRQIMHWDENKKPQFYVFKDCKNTIRTIPGLICDDHRPEDCDTEGEDHIPDAIRYCVMHTYHPRIETPPKTIIEEIIERITTPVSDRSWAGDNY